MLEVQRVFHYLADLLFSFKQFWLSLGKGWFKDVEMN
jgi:hypothetical protein